MSILNHKHYTEQHLFNLIYWHLLMQNEKSNNEPRVNCFYRKFRTNQPPCMCAIGTLIPDDSYTPKMEGRRVSGLNLFVKSKFNLILSWAQDIHDCYPVNTWQSHLHDMAVFYNLTTPELC